MLSPDFRESTAGIEQAFHQLYYDDFENTWETTTWMGHKVLKSPMDLILYQELVHSLRPRIIVETGTAHGGSALFFAHLLQLIHVSMTPRVVTIDIHGREQFPGRPSNPRIEYIRGSSTSHGVLTQVEQHIEQAGGPVLVVLDSDHREQHVYEELEAYHRFVEPGSYLVVEDTNVNGRPVCPEHGPGPAEALERWLPSHPEFQIDRSFERYHLTFNPNGWLARV